MIGTSKPNSWHDQYTEVTQGKYYKMAQSRPKYCLRIINNVFTIVVPHRMTSAGCKTTPINDMMTFEKKSVHNILGTELVMPSLEQNCKQYSGTWF